MAVRWPWATIHRARIRVSIRLFWPTVEEAIYSPAFLRHSRQGPGNPVLNHTWSPEAAGQRPLIDASLNELDPADVESFVSFHAISTSTPTLEASSGLAVQDQGAAQYMVRGVPVTHIGPTV